MMDYNRRCNIAAEIARAEQAKQAAEALIELQLHADAVSRAYFVAMHYLRALLLARGVEPRTFADALHLFNMEFVRNDELPRTDNRVLGSLERARELADYDATLNFTEADSVGELKAAQEFAADARRWLESEGFWPEASVASAPLGQQGD